MNPKNLKWKCKCCGIVFICTPNTIRERINLHVENRHDYRITYGEISEEILKTEKTEEKEGQYFEQSPIF